MPVVTFDPIISYEGNPGTTISGDPTETFNPIVLPPATTYGGNVPVEPLEPLEPIDQIESNDPAVPIQNNPNNSVNYLVGSIREEVISENTQSDETPINQQVGGTPGTYVPPKPNTAIMGGGGSGSSSVNSDLKKTDKKYWWWIAAAVVGIGLYSYKKSK